MSIAYERARLRARVARRYRLVDEPMICGPLRLEFTRIADPREVLDHQIELEQRRRQSGNPTPPDDQRLPYWAELWDTATALATRLAREGFAGIDRRFDRVDVFHHPPRVLDLGCGMGLTSVVAATLGGRVTMLDYDSEALLIARLNTLGFGSRVTARRCDWNTDRLPDRFDLILAADVIYDTRQWDAIVGFIRWHLACDGVAVVGEPGRSSGDRFESFACERGLVVRQLHEPCPSLGREIRIFLLRVDPRASG